MILIDTNIVIDCFRGNENILSEIQKIGFKNIAISSVTVCEMYQGMKKTEKRETIELLRNFNKFLITEAISKRAEDLVYEYFDKGLKLPDALIAATVLENNLQLFTLNKKDFDFIKGIKFYKPTQKLL
jgi:hypothetical protein